MKNFEGVKFSVNLANCAVFAKQIYWSCQTLVSLIFRHLQYSVYHYTSDCGCYSNVLYTYDPVQLTLHRGIYCT